MLAAERSEQCRRCFCALAAGRMAVTAVGGFPAIVRAQPTKLKAGVNLPRSRVQAQLGQSPGRFAQGLKQERSQNPAAAAMANQSDKLPSRLIWSLMAGTR